MSEAGSAALSLSRADGPGRKSASRTAAGDTGRLTVYESIRRPGSPKFIGPARKKRGVVHRLVARIRRLFA